MVPCFFFPLSEPSAVCVDFLKDKLKDIAIGVKDFFEEKIRGTQGIEEEVKENNVKFVVAALGMNNPTLDLVVDVYSSYSDVAMGVVELVRNSLELTFSLLSLSAPHASAPLFVRHQQQRSVIY